MTLMIKKSRLVFAVFVLAVVAVSAGPAFGTTHIIGDPDEAAIPNGYDIETISFDDSNATNLQITWDTYSNIAITDSFQQVQYLLFLDVGNFDQNTAVAAPVTPGGSLVDFQVNWYGSSTDGGGNAIVGAKPSFTLELLAQNGTVMWSTVTADPTGGDTLLESIPWAQLVDTNANLAFPAQTINPPGISGFARLDNGTMFADDLLPDSGDFQVPEPVTMAGLLLAVGSLTGYVRRRRKA